jgi:hypothetical protein
MHSRSWAAALIDDDCDTLRGLLHRVVRYALLLCAVSGCCGQPQPQPMTRAECWDLHCACLVLEGKGDGITEDAGRLAAERIRDMMRRLRPRGGWLND